MISVCMATYNGENYIEAQMESIRKQTLSPDEVIICDDSSTDKTIDVINNFINKYHLKDSWHLYCNACRKGYPGNFYHAMSLCHGDIVFLADQDDIWDLRKIQIMSAILKKEKGINVLCCKFGLVDASGVKIHTLMAPVRNYGTGKLRKVSIKSVFYKCEWPGMVLAYRRSWYEMMITDQKKTEPKGQERTQMQKREGLSCLEVIPHDFLICAWAAEQESFYQLDEELAWHRRHGNNAGKEEHRIVKLLNRERKLQEIRDYIRILDAFADTEALKTKIGKGTLNAKRQVMGQRYEGILSRSAMCILRNVWKNRKWVRLTTVLCDVMIAIAWGRGKKGNISRLG